MRRRTACENFLLIEQSGTDRNLRIAPSDFNRSSRSKSRSQGLPSIHVECKVQSLIIA